MGRGTTTDVQLDRLGKKLFGRSWLGVYPSDKDIMKNVKNLRLYYGIINVDRSYEPGSHWIAIIYDRMADLFHIWDSFGRPSKQLIPNFIKKINYVDMHRNGADQKNKQNSCGQRSIAILLMAKKYGLDIAGRV